MFEKSPLVFKCILNTAAKTVQLITCSRSHRFTQGHPNCVAIMLFSPTYCTEAYNWTGSEENIKQNSDEQLGILSLYSIFFSIFCFCPHHSYKSIYTKGYFLEGKKQNTKQQRYKIKIFEGICSIFNAMTKNYQHCFIDSFIYIFSNNDLLSIVGIILEINYTSLNKNGQKFLSSRNIVNVMWNKIHKNICLKKYVSMHWTLALRFTALEKIRGREEREKNNYVKECTRLGWVGLRNVAHLSCTRPWVWTPVLHKLDVVVHACNPRTWEGRQEDQKYKLCRTIPKLKVEI